MRTNGHVPKLLLMSLLLLGNVGCDKKSVLHIGDSAANFAALDNGPGPLKLTPGLDEIAANNTSTFAATGGTAPYAYTLDNLTAGVIGPTGVFTPNAALSVRTTVIVTVTDQAKDTRSATLVVNPKLSVSPSATLLGLGKKLTWTTKFGVAPYNFSLVTGDASRFDATTGNYTAGILPETPEFKIKDAKGNFFSFKIPVLALDQDDTNCLAGITDPKKVKYDACLMFKNPVAANKAAFAVATNTKSDFTLLQTYGVFLTGLDTSGFLQNASIRVVPTVGTRFKRGADGTFRTVFSNCSAPGVCTEDPNHKIGQVNAYYVLNHEIEYFTARVGNFYASNGNILVDSYQTGEWNAFWDPSSNSITAITGDPGGFGAGQESSLSNEVLIHELGHGSLDYATNHAFLYSDTTETVKNGNVLCKLATGCIGAANEAQADWHAALMYPTNSAFAEHPANDIKGLQSCGYYRDPYLNKTFTAKMGFDACPNSGFPDYPGEIHVHGTAYASAFASAKTAIIAAFGATGDLDFDKMFNLHLTTYSSEDNFGTLLSKLLTIDTNVFAAKYGALIKTAFAGHGITPSP